MVVANRIEARERCRKATSDSKTILRESEKKAAHSTTQRDEDGEPNNGMHVYRYRGTETRGERRGERRVGKRGH